MRLKYLLLLPSLIVGIYLALFGVQTLDNLHNGYLRHEGRKVVMIQNSSGAGGTGSLVRGKSGRKYILTNNHICRLAENGLLFVKYQFDTYLLGVAANYQTNDLCVISAPYNAGATLDAARGRTYGEKVYAIGHPLLEPLSITSGELSGPVFITIMLGFNIPKEQCSGPSYIFEPAPKDNLLLMFMGIESRCIRAMWSEGSTIPILPGNSGSPVLDVYGDVVGVVFASHESGVRSYIVPLEDVRAFLDLL